MVSEIKKGGEAQFMQTINNLELEDFLTDFENNLEVSFDIEESKKSELMDIAKNRGILVEGSRDLAIFSAVYEVLKRPNGNRKIVPLNQEVLRKLPQLVGKPININHIRRYVVGFICDFRYIEKEKKVVIYGVFFKNSFDQEWEKLVEAFKNKKVGLSSEIWSPKSKRVYDKDKNFELRDIEFSGCAIIFINNTDKPAEEDCLILETSKKYCEDNQDLICSVMNKNILEKYNCESGVDCENLIMSSQEVAPPVQTNPSKINIICSVCSHNFEYLFVPNQSSQIKCPNCLSIVDQTGKMLYPAQLQNFQLSCPNCSANNWLILSNDNESAKVKCQSCAKEYSLSFKDIPTDLKMMMEKIQFLNMGSRPCWQCGTHNNYVVPSNQEKINLHCKKCGLDYFFNMSYKIKKDIKTIEEVGIKTEKINKEDVKMFVLEKSKLEITGTELAEFENKSMEALVVEEAKALPYAEEKDLADEAFAVIITVKDKATSEAKKIRKYAINGTSNDEARVIAALRYISDAENRKELEKYEVDVDAVIKKILLRADELGIKSLMQKKAEPVMSRKLLRKAVVKINDSNKSLKEKSNEVVLVSSKLDKFGAGIKKLGGRIRELSAIVRAKDLEISGLKKELEKKAEAPINSSKEPVIEPVEEPNLETASLKVGIDNPEDLSKKNDRIAKVREETKAYFIPSE